MNAPASHPLHLRWGLLLMLAAVMMLTSLVPAANAQQSNDDEGLADNDGVRAVLEGNVQRRLRLALPAAKRPPALSKAALKALVETEKTLRDDLALTGIFEIQGAEVLSALRLSGDRRRDFDTLRSVGNQVALFAEFSVSGNRLTLISRMYDLDAKGMILGKRHAASFEWARRVAHSLNDEIVLFFEGFRGIASTQIAFTSNRDDSRNKELYLMDYDGYDQRRMSGHQSLSFSPSWAADSSGIAYVSYFGGGPSIYWADIESGRKRGVVVDDHLAMSPSVSPDGRQVAFARSIAGNSEIYRVGLDGKGLLQLTNSSGIDTNPAWSPNGRSIAFTSSRSGSPQIYQMNVDGRDLRRLTFEGRYNDGASWHRDGSKITYAARTEDGSRFDIAILDLATMDRRILTRGPGSHEAPSFSPDGRLIAYESSRAGRGGRQIFLMTAEGRQLRQLTSAGDNYAPSWSNYLK